MIRAQTAAAAVAAASLLVALVAGGAVIWRHHKADADRVAACRAVTSLNSERNDSTQPVTTGGPVAVVLGDSYAQGQYLDVPRQKAWSTLVGKERGWTTFVDAVGGTGFSAPGPCGGQSFPERVAEVLAHEPQLVVIEGGLNELGQSPTVERHAVQTTLEALARVPRVIVVGPPRTPGKGDPAATDALLRDETVKAGREYVSTITLAFPLLDDDVHLTEEGHREFAQLVISATG